LLDSCGVQRVEGVVAKIQVIAFVEGPVMRGGEDLVGHGAHLVRVGRRWYFSEVVALR
jgi:hypothetical protein